MNAEGEAADWHARREALKAREAALDAGRSHIPTDGPRDEAGIEAEAVERCRDSYGPA
ncbi:hypothetical protein [Methylobacterium sp. J-067]|uniref:hypothetical protein n=1 Tax=Methylobacterium sp. J-067 TaxID=2836648 RepID=UPI001FB9FE7F|nr:hypothetical protein [Methylobacterium sp. J-067]MCJ2023254.1 hypothetical protein [Methylobacterium sp. J-067]